MTPVADKVKKISKTKPAARLLGRLFFNAKFSSPKRRKPDFVCENVFSNHKEEKLENTVLKFH